MAERAHLSIGEVLSLLQQEFPDVTISKIRFLESQGLLDPERTPSGYRKFYETDIERLRWILTQQRENFLPLRVIKDRLEGRPDSEPVDADGEESPAETPEPVPDPQPQAAAAGARGGRTSRGSHSAQTQTQGGALDSGPSAISLTRAELASSAGLSDRLIIELERYGLIAGRPMGRDTVYDEDALVVARLAAGFLRYGVEARHLRMYKVAAEREASFFEQVVLPLVKQRNPAARRQAVDNLTELAALGESLRGAMLRNALRSYSL
jgi:DNA-binding transcriptional MerR regulator